MNDQLIQDVYQWGADKGLHTPALEPQLIKLMEELGELSHAVAKDRPGEIIDAIGDMLVVMIQFGGCWTTMNADDLEPAVGPQFLSMCLNHAYNQIKDRKGKTVNGIFIKNETPPSDM